MHTLRLAVLLAALIGLPSIAALGRVYVRQDALSLGYRLSVQQQRRDQLRAALRQAELDRAGGRAPAMLNRMAQSLGLRPPTPAQDRGRGRAPAARAHAQPQ